MGSEGKGGLPGSHTHFQFHGAVAEVKLWDAAHDQLVAHWPLCEGQGSRARDRGPHRLCGAIHEAQWTSCNGRAWACIPEGRRSIGFNKNNLPLIHVKHDLAILERGNQECSHII